MKASTSTQLDSVLQRINEQMYERNVELTIRNKTLSVQRALYEIINTTLDMHETARRMIHVMTKQLGFRGGAILLINRKEKTLDVVATATARSRPSKHAVPILSELEKMKVSLSSRHNCAVEVVHTGHRLVTKRMYDLVQPHMHKDDAQDIQKKLRIQTFILYPIIFGGKILGVLVLGIDKPVKDLSRSEKATLDETIDVVGIALEQVHMYEALKKANRRLKELDQMKDDFVSVASHELRTPMTAIKSYIWMALAGKGGKLSKKLAFYLDRSYTSTDRLIKLVNDMLNISRIESGRLSVTFSKVDIKTVVKDVCEEVAPRAKELHISIDTKATQSYFVVADANKIKEVLFNLIGNSLKFTPAQGKIFISTEQKGDMVITNVKDTGRGIDVHDISTLFSKFGMVEGSYATNKKASGTGLGLFISKSIIDLHGGELWPFSEGIDKGSTFSFSLPRYSTEKVRTLLRRNKGKINKGDEKKDIVHTGL